MAKKKTATISEYIDKTAPEARPHLHQMYRILKEVAPEGTGVIKWNVPVFWDHRVIFGFSAYKAHLSFGPGENAVTHFAEELTGYKTGKGTIQFRYDQPLPENLIRRIAEFCVTDEPDE